MHNADGNPIPCSLVYDWADEDDKRICLAHELIKKNVQS